MRVFVTGATGFVGSAIVKELITAGHQVVGLARNASAAEALTQAGAQVHSGAIDDLDSLRAGVAAADAVIHTAFKHDFSKFEENCEVDRQAIRAMGTALEGTDKPFLITSGTGLLSSDEMAVESQGPSVFGRSFPRVATEEAAMALQERGIKASLVRLPPSVHGSGDHGFVPHLINLAREKGVAAYIGEGDNRWPAVHRLDAGRLYRLILESGATEPRYHAVAEEGVPFRDIATVIGRRLEVPVVGKSTAEASQHFEWFIHFATMHNPSSSRRTRELLGWKPQQPELLADVDSSAYFM
ncbi:MAG: SDR family oxidoreductase [Chitinophaga sp.]|uniref:SDR family oxidoreductase n=1 Tax=Chitinophaga sp. TaxID=1869181 RepID=UPI0025B8F770|nr:SDR family oxidoreductase [Chitinophaga sp.]MBV8253558.1 SDR family oxidoreductase [Chitinophaga sp.]